MATQVEVVRVFTDVTGQFGNELGIARADDVVDVDHQALAARLNFSETVVVEQPVDEIAQMRIYTPTTELRFAGHPTVGTAWWHYALGIPLKTLQVPAGPVGVEMRDGVTWITARADWAPAYTFHQLTSVDELTYLNADEFPGGPHYLWVWTDEPRGKVRARMFSPAHGITEDEATGAAAIALSAELDRGLHITQGKGSQLFTEWDSDGWVRLGGRVVSDRVVEI